MTLKKLQKLILEQAQTKGWGAAPEDINFAEKIALVHEEVSEALMAYRKGNMNEKGGVAEELSDVFIRIAHLAALYGVDLETEVSKKLHENEKRDWGWDTLHRHKKK